LTSARPGRAWLDVDGEVMAFVRDSIARLLEAAAPHDGRLAVLEETRSFVGGTSIGSGAILAASAGLPPGTTAVRVATHRTLSGLLANCQTHDDHHAAIEAAIVSATLTGAHEIAHALSSPHDGAPPADPIKWVASSTLSGDPIVIAGHHDAAWAAIYHVTATRIASRLRPCLREIPGIAVDRDLKLYGIPARDLRRAAGSVPPGVSLREWMAPGGEAYRRVTAVVPTAAERAPIVAEWIKPWADNLPARSEHAPQTDKLAAGSVPAAVSPAAR
jgi:hypothetical protein